MASNDNDVDVRIKLTGIEKLDGEVSKAGASVSSTAKEFGVMDTKAGKAFMAIKAGAMKGVAAMKTLKGAVIATGIGALAIAVLGLVQYFTKTEKGAQTLRVVMAVLGQVMAKLMDIFVGIGKALVNLVKSQKSFGDAMKNLGEKIIQNFKNRLEGLLDMFKAIGKILKGDFKEGLKQMADGVIAVSTGVADGTDKIKKMGEATSDFAKDLWETTKAMAVLEQRQNDLNVANREAVLTLSQQQGELTKLRGISMDLSKTDQERIDALNAMDAIQNKMLDDEVKRAKEQYNIIAAKNSLASSSEADLQAEMDAQVKIQDLENQRLNNLNRTNARRASIREQQKAEQEKDAADAQKIIDEKQAADDEAQIKADEAAKLEIERKQNVLNEMMKLEYENYLLGLENDAERRQAALDKEKELYEEDLERKLANEELTQEEMLNLKTAYGELWNAKDIELKAKLKEEADKAAEDELKRQQAVFDYKSGVILSGFKLLSDILGKESKLGKATAVAAVIADAAAAVIGTWRGYAKFGPWGTAAAIIQTGGIAASAATSIGSIKGTKDAGSESAPSKTPLPNKNPFAIGGWIGGSSHADGGTNVMAEDGEFIVNKNTMQSDLGSMVVAANAAGQGAAIPGMGMDENRIASIVARSVGAIPVYVTETAITTKQREVKIRESSYTK